MSNRSHFFSNSHDRREGWMVKLNNFALKFTIFENPAIKAKESAKTYCL